MPKINFKIVKPAHIWFQTVPATSFIFTSFVYLWYISFHSLIKRFDSESREWAIKKQPKTEQAKRITKTALPPQNAHLHHPTEEYPLPSRFHPNLTHSMPTMCDRDGPDWAASCPRCTHCSLATTTKNSRSDSQLTGHSPRLNWTVGGRRWLLHVVSASFSKIVMVSDWIRSMVANLQKCLNSNSDYIWNDNEIS